MSNVPRTLLFGSRQVRTVVMNGVRKFSATDICNILGYVNPNKILNRYCGSTPEYIRMDTTGGPQNFRMISATDIRDILSHSRRKVVSRLRRWLDEVTAPTVTMLMVEVAGE